jgi:hypothetical protein
MNEPKTFEEITKYVNKLYKEEGLTKDLIDAVDLNIAYSPVIALNGEKLHDAVKATRLINKMYRIEHPLFFGKNISKDELKIMRARYILANGKIMQKQIEILRDNKVK